MEGSLMAMVILGLASLVGIANLVCLIIVLIKMFTDEVNGGVAKGIFGFICGLYAFIWGWQNADTHNIRNVMMIWTGCFIANIILNVVGQVMMQAA